MAAATNERGKYYHQGKGPVRSIRRNVVKQGKKIWRGTLGMHVDGVARPLVSGTDMAALCTALGAGGANDTLYVSSRLPGWRVQLADPAGNSKPLVVTSITYGATVDVVISHATDGGGAITSTPAQVALLIQSNATLNQVFRAKGKGTGAAAMAAVAMTAITQISCDGCADETYDASSELADLPLAAPGGVFYQGCLALQATTDAPTAAYIGALVTLASDQEVAKTLDPLAIQAPLLGIEGSQYFVDLTQAR